MLRQQSSQLFLENFSNLKKISAKNFPVLSQIVRLLLAFLVLLLFLFFYFLFSLILSEHTFSLFA